MTLTRARALALAALFLLQLPMPAAAADPAAPAEQLSAAHASDRVIVAWRAGSRGAAVARAHGLGAEKALGAKGAPAVVETNGRPVADVLAELRRDPDVLYAEPDYVVQLAPGHVEAVSVNDPLSSQQYSLDRMRVRDAWSLSTGGSITVAVLDTGVQFNHPDLSGRLLSGRDFVNDDWNAADDNGHGTWVAGIIAARANDGYGISGISWSDKILPVKIMNANGSGYTSHLVEGLRWAADKGAKVINMSIGGYPNSTAVQDAVDYAWGKGAVLVGAAGNNRREETHFPASYNNVVSVSATQADDEFTNWSSYGAKVDVSAPGASIMTTNCEKARTSSCAYYGNHIIISGTSFATPNTAGVVALMWARYPSWTPQQIVDRLIATVDDLGTAGWDKYYGRGRVNAYRALGGSVAAPTIATGDGLESNNAISSAKRISLATLVGPTIHPAGDVDHFAVDVPRAGRLDVTVTAVTDTSRPVKSALPVDPVVELLTTGGSRLALVDNPTNSAATEYASIAVSGPMRVVVRVRNWFPNGSKVAYTIRATYVDNAAPKIADRSPAPNSTDVNRWMSATVTFDEAVSVPSAGVSLKKVATGEVIPISVSYDSSRKQARVTVNEQLEASTAYRLAVSGRIKDLAGNALGWTSWRFTTGEHGYHELGASARLTFRPGTYTAYRFSSSGDVARSRTYTLGSQSGASASLSGSLPGQSGNWFYVTNGVWAGYWMRESAGVSLSGTDAMQSAPANASYSPPVPVIFQQGTHTGYRFDSAGRPTAQRTTTLARASGASTSAVRAISNQYGRWYYVTNGFWAGYWVQASDVVALDPDQVPTLYDPPAGLRFEGGTYTGYRFDSAGSITSTRTFTLGSRSGAATTQRRTLPGQSGAWFRVSNGVWAGYWVREAPGVYLKGTTAPGAPSADRSFDPAAKLVFRKGAHTGYRFDSSGRPRAVRSANLGATSGANTSELRAIPNQAGRWYLVTNGLWAGYWVPASDVIYVP